MLSMADTFKPVNSPLAREVFCLPSVERFLTRHLDHNVLQRVVHTIPSLPSEIPKTVGAVLDIILDDREITPKTRQTLNVVKSIWDLSDEKLSLFGWILESLADCTLECLVLLLYPSLPDPQRLEETPSTLPKSDVSTDDVDKLRSRVFHQYPDLVLWGLVTGERFEFADLQTVVACTLRTMVHHNLTTDDQDLRQVVLTKLAPEKYQNEKQPSSDQQRLDSTSRGTPDNKATQQTIDDALELINTLKILARLVENAYDIPRLFVKGYKSVRSITQKPKVAFVAGVVKQGVRPEDADRIYDYAQRVDCWNEQLWLRLMESRRADCVPLALDLGSGNNDRGQVQLSNNLTDIFRLEETACEECCSTTSLSAYFVHLMMLLNESLVNKPNEIATRVDSDSIMKIDTQDALTNDPKSLLQMLSLRRPDLEQLQVSCVNAQRLIPYINLVNEVLEAFIRSRETSNLKPKPPPQDAQDEGEDSNGHADEPLYHPGNTDYEVYRSIISKQMFPIDVFPYCQAQDAIAQYLTSFNVNMPKILHTFQAREVVLHSIAPDIKPPSTRSPAENVWQRLEAGAMETLQRQKAAVTLSLSQKDFAAITKETFFPGWFAQEVVAASKTRIDVETGCPWNAAQLWGYDPSETSAMLDVKMGVGLAFIKRKLMIKSGLSFDAVLDLVRTQCFNQHLVIVNAQGSKTFTGSLEDLRLLSHASEPPFRPLSEELCFSLQSFIRLQAKVKWSTKDLDATIQCLRARELIISPTSTPKGPSTGGQEGIAEVPAITPYVIKGVAAIVELSKISGLEPAELLPLWGPIDTFGNKSFYHRRFATRQIRAIDPIFGPSEKGDYMDHDGTTPITQHRLALCASLQWPVNYFDDLLKATGLQAEELHLESLSSLYRHVLICRLLEIPERHCLSFFRLFFGNTALDSDPLANPVLTLAAIDHWKKLLDDGWSIEAIIQVLDRTPDGSDAQAEEWTGLASVTTLLTSAKDIQKSFPFLVQPSTPSLTDVTNCASRLFDATTANQVVEFIQATQEHSRQKSITDAAQIKRVFEAIKTLPSKISIVQNIGTGFTTFELRLTGILSTEDREWIENLQNDFPLKGDLQELDRLSIQPREILSRRFNSYYHDPIDQGSNLLFRDWEISYAAHPAQQSENGKEGTSKTEDKASPAASPLVQAQDSQPDTATRTPSTDEELRDQCEKEMIATETQIKDRRAAFMKLAAPIVISDLLQNLILDAIKTINPNLDVPIISMICELVKVASEDGKTVETASAALKHILDPTIKAPIETELNAFFTPSTTDDYTLSCIGSLEQKSIALTVNGIHMPFDPEKKTFQSFRMTGGRTYLLQSDIAPSQFLWSTPKVLPTAFMEGMLLSAPKMRRWAKIQSAVGRVATICGTTNLAVEEVQYVSRMVPGEGKMGFDVNAPRLIDLIWLQKYKTLRDRWSTGSAYSRTASAATASNSLIGVLTWLNQNKDADLMTIARNIALSTGWNVFRIRGVLEAKYATHTGAELANELCKIDSLLQLQTIMLLDHDMTGFSPVSSQLPMSAFFELACPRPTLDTGNDFALANLIQARLTESQRAAADQKLMENQRQALVSYLVNAKSRYKGLENVDDADHLFEYFLVDVQMGPQLRTSRIKQAISVLQLFAQRCLLGLEAGVSKDTLVRETWERVKQYSLWEAQRKLFLYPENWIDPSLRDDKSDLFIQFENSLMQKNLNLTTFQDAIKTYVYQLNEISSLEIVAYLHDAVPGESDIFHLFGRTRTSPHAFYYRTLTKLRPIHNLFWRPWVKIEMDVPSVESAWNGTRLSDTGAYLLPVVHNHRLYLFMPQIHAKSRPKHTSSAKFTEYGDKPTQDGAPDEVWDIMMGWSEFLKDTWSPKRMSPGSLTVKNAQADISQFRFDPVFDKQGIEEGKLTIVVSYGKQTLNGTLVGGFVFSDDQINAVQHVVSQGAEPEEERKNEEQGSAANLESLKNVQETSAAFKELQNSLGQIVPPSRRFDTVYFQKLSVDVKRGEVGSDFHSLIPGLPGDDSVKRDIPRDQLVWIAPELDELIQKTALDQTEPDIKTLTWTLASSNRRTDVHDSTKQYFTGLAVSSKRADGTCVSYFNVPQFDLWKEPHTSQLLRDEVEFVILDHTFSHKLVQKVAKPASTLQNLYTALSDEAFTQGAQAFGTTRRTAVHELGQPSAIYNWELGLHTIMLAVDRFFATQQFDQALEVARLVFDPTIDTTVKRLMENKDEAGAVASKKMLVSYLAAPPLGSSGSALSSTKIETEERPASCWRFPPFQDLAYDLAQSGEKAVELNKISPEIDRAILERRSHGALVHATARGRPEAYMKWFVMKYVEILVASGDVHFRQGTLESLPLAIQQYIEAAHVLGRPPPKVPKLGKNRPNMSFMSLKKQETATLSLDLPFSVGLDKKPRGSADKTSSPSVSPHDFVCSMITPYFGVPLNPQFKQLRNLVNTRLFNIRNSLDIEGRPVSYSLIEPLIDPGALVSLSKQGVGMADALAMVIGERDGPLPRQRVEVLLHRATELCLELRTLGERFLLAIEKKEAEMLNVLHARHTTTVNQLMLDVRTVQLKESEQVLESLCTSREAQVSQLEFYLALIGEPKSKVPKQDGAWEDIAQEIDTPSNDDLKMSSYEKADLYLTTVASGMNVAATVIDGLVVPFCAVPQLEVYAAPLGVGTSVSTGGNNIVRGMNAASTLLRAGAMGVGEAASWVSRKAQLTRQVQERRLQANIRGREIKSIDQQIKIQYTRIQAARKEIEVQTAQMNEATQMEAWYRSKYTGEQLYGWVEKNLRALYHQAYVLAMTTARRAESALSFEHGRRISILRPGGYWDASRDGLLAADYLLLDLKRLESLHLDSQLHDYEISKTISLREIDPMALLRLRSTGTTEFSVGELLYDMDYPGHYMRRIRSVAVSLPAVLGPHSSVNATLTLAQHKYRTSANATRAEEYMSTASSSTDESFRTDRIPIKSVAISSGAHDSGVFELAFAGPRYVPFEGAGAISSWRLDLPTKVRKFDYDSISDVLLHVQYTALDGGACLRTAANDAVSKAGEAVESQGRQTGFWAMWDMKNDFPTQWHGFCQQLTAKTQPTTTPSFQLGSLRDRLPFWSRQQASLHISDLQFVSKNNNLISGLSIKGQSFEPKQHGGDDTPIGGFGGLHVKSFTKLGLEMPKTLELESQPLALGEATVDNVYLVIRYYFK